jgi:hypothetical protein
VSRCPTCNGTDRSLRLLDEPGGMPCPNGWHGGDLVEWLTAQLDADEQAARKATSGGPWRIDGMSVRAHDNVLVIRHTWPQEAEHIVRHDPLSVLRTIAAHRAIIDSYRTEAVCESDAAVVLESALHAIAAIYQDRPGFDLSWIPGDR